jgi:hypothetical protein
MLDWAFSEESKVDRRYWGMLSRRLLRERHAFGCACELHKRDLKANHPAGWRDVSPSEAEAIRMKSATIEGPMPEQGVAYELRGLAHRARDKRGKILIKTAAVASFSKLNSRQHETTIFTKV